MGEIRLAGCVIRDEEGRILLLHRVNPSQWELPGGRIEPGEQGDVAARREVAEELGLVVGVTERLGEGAFIENGTPFSYTWYSASDVSGTPLPQEAKHDDARFFSISELQQMSAVLTANVRNLLPELLRAQA